MIHPIEMSFVSEQDRGQLIDLLHHAVDLVVCGTADRDVRQCPREDVAGRPRDFRSLSATSLVMRR